MSHDDDPYGIRHNGMEILIWCNKDSIIGTMYDL